MAAKNQYDEWTDAIGHTIRPGDTVAVATIEGQRPVIVIGEIVRINSHDSKGQPIVGWHYYESGGRSQEAQFPSCTITVRPTGETRFDTSSRRQNLVTYRIPANVLLVEAGARPVNPLARP